MRIAMIGTGYVGLVSGTCFAEFGMEVRGHYVCKDVGWLVERHPGWPDLSMIGMIVSTREIAPVGALRTIGTGFWM